MKINRPNVRGSSTRGAGRGEKASKADAHERIEAADAVDRADEVDRFERGGSGQQEQQEELTTEEAEMIAALLENPRLARQTEWGAMLGLDALPSSVETAMASVLAFADTESE